MLAFLSKNSNIYLYFTLFYYSFPLTFSALSAIIVDVTLIVGFKIYFPLSVLIIDFSASKSMVNSVVSPSIISNGWISFSPV